MNSLEFIDQEIRSYEQLAILSSDDIKKRYEKCVLRLQQIKAILEAWEVVKKYTDTSDDIVNTEFYLHIDFKSDIEDFKIMKKALEVEDE